MNRFGFLLIKLIPILLLFTFFTNKVQAQNEQQYWQEVCISIKEEITKAKEMVNYVMTFGLLDSTKLNTIIQSIDSTSNYIEGKPELSRKSLDSLEASEQAVLKSLVWLLRETEFNYTTIKADEFFETLQDQMLNKLNDKSIAVNRYNVYCKENNLDTLYYAPDDMNKKLPSINFD